MFNPTSQVPVMQKIRDTYITNAEFDPNKVAKASSAAEGLCKWIKAMEVYDRVAKVQGLSNLSIISLHFFIWDAFFFKSQSHLLALGCRS